MNQQTSYSQPYHGASTHKYLSTSSAFSASANPNEDWTKISDLAERRRIQNRIAQRNYRKKLKKRLENLEALEARAKSTSASPEPKPAQLARPSQSIEVEPMQAVACSTQQYLYEDQTSQAPSLHYMPSFDDGSMFSEQYTRQLSTSPPPALYTGYASEPMNFASFSHDMPFATMAANVEAPIFPLELPPLSSPMLQTLDFPVKQESYMHPELTAYNLNYASMTSLDITAAQSYSDSNPHTPPLSECCFESIASSPPEMAMPSTPPFGNPSI